MQQNRIAFLESSLSGTGNEAIRTAKRLGHHVTLITRDLDYYRQAGRGFDEALIDQVIICDTDDAETVASAVTRHGGADALLTMSEWHVVVTAQAAARLRLVGADPDAVRAARDKSRTRALCSASGVPIPAYHRLTNAVLPPAFPLPCVIKPVDGALSSGVKLCRTGEEARQHTQALLDQCAEPNERGQRRTPAVLIEEYLVGPEFSVETLTYQGRTHVVAITQKLLSPPPLFFETGHVVPAALPEPTWQACADLVRAALAAIGYEFGAAHVELRVTAAGPKLIEINCRPAGDLITHLATLASGVDLVAELIDMHLGRAPRLTPDRSDAAAIVFLPSREGVVDRIEGMSQALAGPGVSTVSLYVGEGAELAATGSNSDRLGHVIAVGPDPEVALGRAQAAAGQVQVSYREVEVSAAV
ncbi:cysteine synthase A/argininosuccinate lyase [Actinoplanes campanulatus]|uniref:Cysteine synthase A/argininosuccinate lyase n=1 Tax=Actinoplanes campanulatus TaxID=113559 RepID=A0A7W5AKN7_9ACTN|nr:ATP-grasp domain-containing protein [Actinoplanes campanulatus]MBB3097905.1 cysteine synthase A/argininosuccinate lyase [Actinoplanes campanulatus]